MNLYVNKTSGLDTNDGTTPTTAVKTLTKAKALTVAGDNYIYIAIDDYTENVAWNNSGKYIILIGDTDGTIFGTVSGTVRIIQTFDSLNYNIKRCDNLIIRQTNGNGTMFYNNDSANVWCTDTLIFNNCIFEFYYYNIAIITELTDINIIFNNCSGTNNSLNYAYNFRLSSYCTANTQLTLNNCDFYTNLKALEPNIGSNVLIPNTTINSNSIVRFGVGSGIYSPTCKINIYDTTWKIEYKTTSWNSTSFNINSSIVNVGAVNTLKNITGINNYDDFYNLFNNTTGIKFTRPYVTNITNDTIYKMQEFYKIYAENLNGDNTKYIITPFNVMIKESSEVYNGKNVFTFKPLKTKQTIGKSPYYIPLSNIGKNKTYTLNFDYKRNTQNACGINVKIVKGQDGNDISFTNGLYIASEHTNNTWYSKSLTFTTDSSDDEYFIMYELPITGTGFPNEMHFTYPTFA